MEMDLMQVLFLSEVYKLLGDKTRLTIMALLQVQSLCVRDLVEILQTSQPSVSCNCCFVFSLSMASD